MNDVGLTVIFHGFVFVLVNFPFFQLFAVDQNYLKLIEHRLISVFNRGMMRKKEGDLTKSHDKAPIPTENSKPIDNTKTPPKTSITQRLTLEP